ncbi:MAG: class I SAM-dependent methyltransferase [Acidimicrobiales bacterium]
MWPLPAEPAAIDAYGGRTEVFTGQGREPVFGRIEQLIRARCARPGRVLDVGCGGGGFMAVARARGWESVGVDIHRPSIDFARERGLEAVLGTVMDLEQPPGFFDAAVTIQALEYMAAPWDVLGRLRALLRPGGVVAIEAANSSYHRVQARIARRALEPRRVMSVEFHPDRRLFAFGPNSLARLLVRSGFEAVEVVPSVARSEGSALEKTLRRVIFRGGDALYQLTRRRVVVSPSMIVLARRD